MSLNTNVASLRAQTQLARNSQRLSAVFERLSSGQRINRASDDAAGLAIASTLTADARVFTQGIRNVNDGISAQNIAAGTLDQLTGVLQRLKELATQSANGVFGRTQRISLDTEAFALTNEFNRLVASSKFNGLGLLSGNLGRLNIQLGYGTDGQIGFNLGSDLSRNVGVGSFQASTTLANGVNGRGVEMGDFNGDGKQDLVHTAFSSNPGVYVSMGRGDGTFEAAVSYSIAGSSATGIAISDLDGDGDLDLGVTGGAGNQALYILRNQGNGTFGTSTSLATISGLTGGIGAADLNGDGAYDLVARSPTSIEVYLNNGNGTFKAAVSYLTSAGGNSITIGDLNGDNRIDVLTDAVTGTNLFMGNGDGSFRSYQNFSHISSGGSLDAHSVGDINHDGNLDFVAAGGGTQTPLIYLGNGDGTFRNVITFAALGAFNYTVKLSDLNGDGYLDLVAGESAGTKLSIFMGNGDGTFKTAVTIASTTSYDLAIGDLNGDGVSDIASSTYNNNTIQIALQNSQVTTSIGRINLTTRQASLDALSQIDSIMQRVSNEIGNIGAAQSRLFAGLNNLLATRDRYLESASRITSADIAEESAQLARQSILQNIGASVLAQANQAPALALLLLKS